MLAVQARSKSRHDLHGRGVDKPAAITDRETGRQRGIQLAVRGWPSTGNPDWPLTVRWATAGQMVIVWLLTLPAAAVAGAAGIYVASRVVRLARTTSTTSQHSLPPEAGEKRRSRT